MADEVKRNSGYSSNLLAEKKKKTSLCGLHPVFMLPAYLRAGNSVGLHRVKWRVMSICADGKRVCAWRNCQIGIGNFWNTSFCMRFASKKDAEQTEV
jgi:hypothetical protein